MRKEFLYVPVIIILALFFDSCRGKKEMVRKDSSVKKESEALKGIMASELDYRTIEIKCSTRAELDGNKYALNITYRNVRDEKIWASVRAMLGVEAARIYADRDSLWIVSKIAQVKEKGSWSEMSKILGYPLDFMAFQAIMSRKVFYPGTREMKALNDYILNNNGSLISLTPDPDKSSQTDSDDDQFMPKFYFLKNGMKLKETVLSPESEKWKLDVTYDYNSVSNRGIGNNIILDADDSQTKMSLDLKIQQVNVDEPLKMPFQWF